MSISRRAALAILGVFAGVGQQRERLAAEAKGLMALDQRIAPPSRVVLRLADQAGPVFSNGIGEFEVHFKGEVLHVPAREIFEALKSDT